jgi:uncharacterized protein
MAATVAPVTTRERIHEVDVVRGVAILGILVVNMALFFSPLYLEILGKLWFTDTLEVGVKRTIVGFAQGKFYTIFSILFGFGLAIQFERFRAGELSFPRFWVRRMLVLLGIGLIHGLLIWYGDILTWYALAGLALFFFRKARPVTLKIWALTLLLVPLLFMGACTSLLAVGKAFPEAAEQIAEDLGEQRETILERLDEAAQRYPEAGYGETVSLNFKQWSQVASFMIFMLPNVLGMFVIGLLFARYRVFHDVANWVPRLRRSLIGLIPVAVVANGAFAYYQPSVDNMIPTPASWGLMVVSTIGQLTGCLTYIFLLLLAYHSSWAHRFVVPIGAVGRMALTNYLTHSIVFTTLANGYGAGLYGRISPSVGLVLTLAIFAIQIVLSNLWLARFRFGPLEWLWRSLTYGRLQSMRRGT